MRVLVPAAAALALLSIVTERDRDMDHDLHLIAPERARPGDPIPLRAHVYGDLRRPEGARLLVPAVDVELRARGRRLARTRLRPAFANTLEGQLSVPKNARGELTLLASAFLDGGIARTERAMRVLAEPGPLQPLERANVQPLQGFAAGPIVAQHGAQPPNALELRIAGGLCVPEHVCEVFVHVGAPAAAVLARGTASVSPDRASSEPAQPTDGVRRLGVVTHGPEAVFDLVALREGTLVAMRSIRLAVGLGADVLRPVPHVLGEGRPLTLGLDGTDKGCIVDAFHERRWARSLSLRDCRGSETLPRPALAHGLWRLQARRDPFGVQSAAARSLFVRGAGASERDVLAALARHVLADEPHDALARAVAARPEAYVASLDEVSGYLLAALDGGVMPLPAPASGYPAALVELGARRARVRTLALATLILCALCLALLVAQRGLSAAEQAEQLMSDAGEEPRRLRRQRARRTLTVLSAVLGVLLVFAAIAAYVVARGG